MQEAHIHLAGLPLVLRCFENSCIVISRKGSFTTIFDTGLSGNVVATIMNEGIRIGLQEYSFDKLYEYKHLPELKSWLQRFQLQSPF